MYFSGRSGRARRACTRRRPSSRAARRPWPTARPRDRVVAPPFRFVSAPSRCSSRVREFLCKMPRWTSSDAGGTAGIELLISLWRSLSVGLVGDRSANGCGSSSPTDFSPVHRRFLLADGPFGALCAGTSAHRPFFGQPARPDQRCLGAPIRPTGPPPGHSRSVLVACRGKGDASEMAVVTTTRLSGRAFRVALGATSGRGRLNRRRHRAGETLETVGVCPLVGNAQRRWRES